MNTQTIAVGLIALLIGALGGYAIHINPESTAPVHSMDGMMSSMSAVLDGKTGDEFDQAFLTEMIAHHAGAIQMAELALKNAKHDEIRTTAQAIITAQDAEIKQMRTWQGAWYGTPDHTNTQ